MLYNKELAEEEAEADKAFHQIRSALEQLIVQAESALIQKSKQSGKVLQDYTYQKEDEGNIISLFLYDVFIIVY